MTAVKITVNKADRGPDDFWSNIGLSEIEIYGEESDIEAAENKNHVNAARRYGGSVYDRGIFASGF